MQRRIIVPLFTLLLLIVSVLLGANLVDTTQARMSPQGGSDGNAEAMPALQGQPAVDYLKHKGLFDRVKASVEASRYEINWQTRTGTGGFGGAHQANNPRQNLQAWFTRDGVQIAASRVSKRQSWQLGMKLRGIGYGDEMSEVISGPLRVTGSRVEIPHPTLVEWYVNKPEGIEQAFTVAERPREKSGDEPLRVALALTGGLKASVEDGGQAMILSRRDGKQMLRYDHLAANDALGHRLVTRIELREDEISLLVDDSNAVYPVTIDPLFSQVKKLTAGDGAAVDEFGTSVGISGDTVVVGAPFKNSLTGAAYIFGRNEGGADNWGQVKKLTASDAVTNDDFGFSVGISGDTVVVGAYNKNSETGAAYIYERNQGGAENWGQVQKLTASDAAINDRFGIAVGISGDAVVVGAQLKNTFTGAAYIFGRNQGGADNWGQVKKLTASDAATNDGFGISVGISSDTVVVGADQFNCACNGKAYIFGRNQGGVDNWGQVKKLTASDGAALDEFGLSVGISGDTVVVGAPDKNFGTGAAYGYGRNQGGADNWGQVKELTASDGAPGDTFGESVGISGDTVVVGAYSKNSETGAAYIYERNQGGAENWGQVQKLTASDAAIHDRFGLSVGIGGDTVVVGAQFKNSFTGAAYIFALNTPPSITAAPLTRSAGDPLANSTIASVSDSDQEANTLIVTVNGGASATVNGVRISNITVDAMGMVKADVAVRCGAMNANFTLEVSDSLGETATDTLVVMVTDTTAPTLTLKPSIQLWPPNHQHRTVTISQIVASVSDGCNTALSVDDVRIEKVTSDEPDNGEADGNTTNDILIAANCQSVQLRSERDGAKNGRVYSITLRVRDASGNATRQDFKVSVPKSNNGVSAVQDATAQTLTSSCP
jgi:hypothetical protein